MLPVHIGYKTITVTFIDNPMGDNSGLYKSAGR
jgi:hypothetical protein